MVPGIEVNASGVPTNWIEKKSDSDSSDSDFGSGDSSSSSSSGSSSPSALFPHSSAVWVEGAIIVGAGPSGLAVAACLKERGIPSIVLDRHNCIASLWQLRTYDRLHLHIAKHFCELPLFPFAEDIPLYPTKDQFIAYLQDYARHFSIQPLFDRCVVTATYETDHQLGRSYWRVETVDKKMVAREVFLGRWLVVATGENDRERIPDNLKPGLDRFQGTVLHSSEYRNGKPFMDKRVLVVGCGNSGMEIALDLVNYGAHPSIVVRSPVHILPKEMFGRSTFAIAMACLKVFPLRITDALLVLYANLVLGSTSKYGIKRPATGPLETKAKFNKTPTLDMGAFNMIRNGNIKVMPNLEEIREEGVYFVNGDYALYDSIILATGYRSGVPLWFKDNEDFFSEDGFPRAGWKCGKGLFVAGLSKQGISGVCRDARCISEEIAKNLKS